MRSNPFAESDCFGKSQLRKKRARNNAAPRENRRGPNCRTGCRFQGVAIPDSRSIASAISGRRLGRQTKKRDDNGISKLQRVQDREISHSSSSSNSSADSVFYVSVKVHEKREKLARENSCLDYDYMDRSKNQSYRQPAAFSR